MEEILKLYEAIKKADLLRENMIPEEIKAEWIFNLECEFAEMMGIDTPENSFPANIELMMPYPYDESYYLYLITMIDYSNQDIAMYENSRVLSNESIQRAKAWYRRNHRPATSGNWRVM